MILVVEKGMIVGSVPELPCDLSEGSLRVGHQTIENIIPLPLDYRRDVQLTLVTQTDSGVIVRGSAISATPVGEPKFVEEFPGVS